MMFRIRSEWKTIPGPSFQFDCPSCHRSNVMADSFERQVRMSTFFDLIPLGTAKERHVSCRECKAPFFSKLPLDKLCQCERIEIAKNLRDAAIAGLYGKYLAIGTLLMFWLPVVSPILSLISLFLLRNKSNGLKRIAYLALILSIIFNLLFIFYIPRRNAEKCANKAIEFAAKISASNHCNADTDCYDAGAKNGCPFACDSLMNRGDFSSLTESVNLFHKECGRTDFCKQSCPPPAGKLVCKNSVCVRDSLISSNSK